jgi:HTH-type transcriptional regulator/antitoxin HigA
MATITEIFNESEAKAAKAAIAEIEHVLESERYFEPIIAGLPIEVISGYRRALRQQLREIKIRLEAYEAAKVGDYSALKREIGGDLGVALIVARIARGISQKELARRLGLKEQQIQRYEADRYRSINLSNYRRIAHVLGAHIEIKLCDENTKWLGFGGWELASEIDSSVIKKIVKHAKENDWLEEGVTDLGGEESYSYLQRYITDHILSYGSPALLRTGMNVTEESDDILLVAWKARVTRLAEAIIAKNKITYSGLDISWLRELVKLSALEDGPAQARDFLMSRGVVLVCEPQIPGLKLDGAAYLIGSTPVIGLTLRRDTLDNFWFTLLHEIAHVILHYRNGLRLGFFDDTDCVDVDELEKEADRFASNMLIPDEKWKRSPARISKSAAVIEKFAQEMGINSAIAFGRIQKERADYATFSGKIGRGQVRKWLLKNC